MITNRLPGRRALPVACLAFLVCACVADDAPTQADRPAQPALATYDCGEDGSIMVQSMTGSVRLTETEGEGEMFDLPASPPTQANRFGEGSYALVVEDREALWMKAGKVPMTCRR